MDQDIGVVRVWIERLDADDISIVSELFRLGDMLDCMKFPVVATRRNILVRAFRNNYVLTVSSRAKNSGYGVLDHVCNGCRFRRASGLSDDLSRKYGNGLKRETWKRTNGLKRETWKRTNGLKRETWKRTNGLKRET